MEEKPKLSKNNAPMNVDAAKASVDRAMAFIERMDLDGALTAFSEIEPAVQFSKDQGLRVQWARCLNGIGFIVLMDGKAFRGELGDLDEEMQTEFHGYLRRALAHFEQASAIQTDPTYRPYIEGNRAYCLALLGRNLEAQDALSRLFSAKDKAMFDGQIKDTRRLTVPEDARVVRLINEVWGSSKSET